VISSERIVLYVEASWSSPWVCVVHVVLREKGIPFTTARAMMRKGVGAVDLMRERTFTGTAPVLQHGEFWLAESLAIIEYLEEMFPNPPMLPLDVRERARARQLMAWMRHEHDALRRERPAERILYPSAQPLHPLSDEAQRAAESLVRVATRLGADARGALFGTFGVIDVDLAFALMRLVATGFDVPETLRAYARTIWERPSVREFVEHERPPNAPDT
jgi:glutathione S-transferase